MLKITYSDNPVKSLGKNRPSRLRHVSLQLMGSLLSHEEPIQNNPQRSIMRTI